jgi:hypothetical protein
VKAGDYVPQLTLDSVMRFKDRNRRSANGLNRQLSADRTLGYRRRYHSTRLQGGLCLSQSTVDLDLDWASPEALQRRMGQ